MNDKRASTRPASNGEDLPPCAEVAGCLLAAPGLHRRAEAGRIPRPGCRKPEGIGPGPGQLAGRLAGKGEDLARGAPSRRAPPAGLILPSARPGQLAELLELALGQPDNEQAPEWFSDLQAAGQPNTRPAAVVVLQERNSS
jgi:hypothetical protein